MKGTSLHAPETRARDVVVCSMCGHPFDPAKNSVCETCPLKRGCTLVRCPVCGFESVNPADSSLARLARRIFTRGERVQGPGVQNQPNHLEETNR